jgi:competence protein ComEC
MEKKIQNIRILFYTIIFLGISFAIFSLSSVDTNDEYAYVHMLNIGQGDSFLIESKNHKRILIDGGRDAKVLTELEKVLPFGEKDIDVVIATHPDADHIGGLPFVFKRYDVGLFLTSKVNTDTKTFKTLFDSVKEENIPAYYARSSMNIKLDDETNFKILFPDRDTTNWETNSASVVGRLQIGERSALFTGDSPSAIEHLLAKTSPKDIDVDILKLGHHGSKTSTSMEFLKYTTPALALISAGVGNSYGHPKQEVLDELKSLDIPWVSTQDVGTFTIKTDGDKWYK